MAYLTSSDPSTEYLYGPHLMIDVFFSIVFDIFRCTMSKINADLKSTVFIHICIDIKIHILVE